MSETFLSRLADRLILCPTRHAIPTDGKNRRWVAYDDGQLEVWTHLVGTTTADDVDLFVLKFPGTMSRAECSTDHPADGWPGVRADIWAVNPPGYGGSSGRATLRKMSRVAQAVIEELHSHAAGRPIVVVGNSLGCVNALYLAARHDVAGLILRNPPALREVIVGRFGWRTLFLGARLVAGQIPPELCCIDNAARATAPAILVISGQDRIVPPAVQQKIVDAYRGPKQVLILPDADHATPMTEPEAEQYRQLLRWLGDRLQRGPR
jgi:pimeloyl-ACP methyl ester carboxylesterase